MNIKIENYPILKKINTPKELKKISKKNLLKLCTELRNFLLESVSSSSGHLASGLGVIELTVALHYVYKTPFDNLIWDVGHQAYPHKILTGRKNKISTIRKENGLHPFPFKMESEYDIFGVGHSSTSISAGLGMALAAEYENKNRKTVCVIGDGGITAGIAFEAINHAGSIKKDILIILNDNTMSISKNVGALNNYSKKILHKNHKNSLTKKKFNNIIIKKISKKIKKYFKKFFNKKNIFEELGFNYIGPIDGHNLFKLIKTLTNIKNIKGPKFLHILTKKGKGYKPAEIDPIKWHSVPKFNPKAFSLPKNNEKSLTFSQIFGHWLCIEASEDNKLIAITPAMKEGSGMSKFSTLYPKQYFDVAIAEQHAVTFAAGLAIGGYKPVVSIYSTFLQRAYDQIIHDVALQKLPIVFAIDRAGIVGEDGPTHQGVFDLSFLRCIPNVIIMSPSEENELFQMLHTAYHYKKGPIFIRYPKGIGSKKELQSFTKIPIGKGIIKRVGKKIAFLNFGTLIDNVINAAKIINGTVVDMRFVKPIDEELILQIAKKHKLLITLEENTIIGGAGSAVNDCLLKNRKTISILNLGIPDYYILQGNRNEINKNLGLDTKGILKSIHNYYNKNIFSEKKLKKNL